MVNYPIYGGHKERILSKLELLVNTIDSYYSGTLPLDFYDSEHTVRFEITASGSWELQILPFSNVRVEAIPGLIQGNGNDVVVIRGGKPDLLKVDGSTVTSTFVIWGWTERGRDLLVIEIGAYTGTVLLDAETMILVVMAEGNWSLEVTASN